MGSIDSLIWGFLFGTIGVGYLIYGKKQQRWSAFIAGLGMVAFTYFISNPVLIIAIGIVLMILPFVLKF